MIPSNSPMRVLFLGLVAYTIKELIHSELFTELLFQEYNCYWKILSAHNNQLVCCHNIWFEQFIIIWSQ